MKVKYNIPKSFKMGGHTVKVELLKDIEIPGAVGICYYNRNLIRVQTHEGQVPMPVSKVEQIYWHEFSHYLLDHCKFEDLSMNEHLVDLMGECMQQTFEKVTWNS
jgi:hypothetical protein